jgi:hypothetical protein
MLGLNDHKIGRVGAIRARRHIYETVKGAVQ